MIKRTALFTLFIFFMLINAKAQKKSELVTVTVEVYGVNSSKGQLTLAVFDSKENYLKKEMRLMVINLDEERKNHVFEIKDLPIGKYAISVIHDENLNGELDIGLMGPEEQYGFSNNVRGTFGPAPFRKAVMAINKNTKTSITLN